MTPLVRPVADHDWPGIVALEAETYRGLGLSENPAALASRMSRPTSFVLDDGGAVAGYLLALPYPWLRWPDLRRAEETVFASTNLHLHDLVVAPAHRRAGLGGRLLHHLVSAARGQAYETIALVSVAGSGPFWSAHGFRPHPRMTLPAGYGPGATYLSRPL
jgi:predicted N-acetyltransferase YhbS